MSPHPAGDGWGNDGRNWFLRVRCSSTLQDGRAGRGKQYTGVPLVLRNVSPFVSMVPGRVCKSLVTPEMCVLPSRGDPD